MKNKKIMRNINKKNKRKIMSKKGAFTDLFLFLIVTFTLLIVCGIMIYIAHITNVKLKEELSKPDVGLKQDNINQTIEQTFGKVDISYQALYYLSLFIIVAMIISIFAGSYYVTTHPLFFVPYIFIVIIATIVSVVVSNAYWQVASEPTLASTFAGFIGSNYIMYYLPVWVVVIGFVGGIIMFVRMRSEEQQY